jgi:hypothetical protein
MSRNESIPEPIAGMATDINFLLSAAANALVTTPLRSYLKSSMVFLYERMNHRSGLAGVVSEKAGQEMEKECKRFFKDHKFLSPLGDTLSTPLVYSNFSYEGKYYIIACNWTSRKT